MDRQRESLNHSQLDQYTPLKLRAILNINLLVYPWLGNMGHRKMYCQRFATIIRQQLSIVPSRHLHYSTQSNSLVKAVNWFWIQLYVYNNLRWKVCIPTNIVTCLNNSCKCPQGRSVATSGQVGLSQTLPTLSAVALHHLERQISSMQPAVTLHHSDRHPACTQPEPPFHSLVTGVGSQRLLEADEAQ